MTAIEDAPGHLDEELLRRAALGQITWAEKVKIKKVLVAEVRAEDPKAKYWECPWQCKNGHVGFRYIGAKHCVECHHEYQKDYLKAYKVEYRKVNAEAIKARDAKYYKANAEAIKVYKVEYRKANAEAIKTQRVEYRKANPEIINACARNRIARKRNAYGTHTAADATLLLDRQIGLCANPQCLRDVAEENHLDHIYPLSRGGRNDLINLQILCATCNLNKNAKTMDEWLDPDSYATWRAAREVYYPTDVASLITPDGYTGPMTEVEDTTDDEADQDLDDLDLEDLIAFAAANTDATLLPTA